MGRDQELSVFVFSQFCVIRWEGKEENEIGKCAKTGEIRVRVDPKYYRPTEVELLWGDPTKAQKQLGWKRKCSLDVLLFLFFQKLSILIYRSSLNVFAYK